MGDHLAISGGLSRAPLNTLKTDVSRGPPGLPGGPGPLGPHRNSTTAFPTGRRNRYGIVEFNVPLDTV